MVYKPSRSATPSTPPPRLSAAASSRRDAEASPYRAQPDRGSPVYSSRQPKMMPARCSDGPARKRALLLNGGRRRRTDDAQDDAPTCEVCGRHPRKYCCPRCAWVTCSLACCAAHKRARAATAQARAAARPTTRPWALRELRADCGSFLEGRRACSRGSSSARVLAPSYASAGGSGGALAVRLLGVATRCAPTAERRRIRLLLMPDAPVTTRADDGLGELRDRQFFSRAGQTPTPARRPLRRRARVQWRVEWRVDGATLVASERRRADAPPGLSCRPRDRLRAPTAGCPRSTCPRCTTSAPGARSGQRPRSIGSSQRGPRPQPRRPVRHRVPSHCCRAAGRRRSALSRRAESGRAALLDDQSASQPAPGLISMSR